MNDCKHIDIVAGLCGLLNISYLLAAGLPDLLHFFILALDLL